MYVDKETYTTSVNVQICSQRKVFMSIRRKYNSRSAPTFNQSSKEPNSPKGDICSSLTLYLYTFLFVIQC